MLVSIAGRLPSLEKTVWVLLALFVITLPGFTRIGKDIFYVLLLISLIYMAVERPKFSSLNKDEKIIFSLLILFFLWTVFTFYINGKPGKGDILVWSRQVFLLLIIPLYFLFRRYPLPPQWLFIVLLLSAFVTSGVAINDVFFDGARFRGRAGGGMHPILFGSVSLFMAVLISSFLLNTKQNKIFSVLSILAIVGLLAAIALTKARGVWLAIPALILVVLLMKYKNVEKWKKITGLSIIMALLLGSYFIPVVKQRVDQTYTNIVRYINSEDISDASRRTSLGTRLEMWKAGLGMFVDNPVLGVGLGGFQETANKNMDQYGVNRSAHSFYHPHNQYISELSAKGLPGFLLFIGLLYIMIRYYLKYAMHGSRMKMTFAFGGFLMTVAIVIFSLTDAVFEGKAIILFMSMMFAVILASLSNAENQG